MLTECNSEFFKDATVVEGFEAVRERLTNHRAAAVCCEGNRGRYFLFGADLPQTNCTMVGYVPNMSHEIRTPMNAIIGMNEMILRKTQEADTIRYSQNVSVAGETLLSIINDIPDFSKIESGKMKLVEDKYAPDEIIKNLVNMIKPRVEGKSLAFKVNVNPDIPNDLFGDSVRIRQVAVNLLTHAVKYTQTGSVTFDLNF